MDRLGVPAIPGQIEGEELPVDLELFLIDVLVVVHEEPHGILGLILERAHERRQPVRRKVLRLVDDQRVELWPDDIHRVDERVRQLLVEELRRRLSHGVIR